MTRISCHFTQLKKATQSILNAQVPKITNSTNFILFNFIFTAKFPWQCPKPIMITCFHEKHEFLQAGIYLSEEPVKSMDLTRITRISSISRLQGPHGRKIFSRQNFKRLQQLHIADPLNIAR